MSQIYILTPTISEKRPINNRHKHITYPEANNSNNKFELKLFCTLKHKPHVFIS